MGLFHWLKSFFTRETDTPDVVKNHKETIGGIFSTGDGVPHRDAPRLDRSKTFSGETFPRIRPVEAEKPEPVKIWVGMDFGTSFTKLAYKVLGGARKVFPLNLNSRSSIRYGLPSLLAFNGDTILFGDDAEEYLRDKPWYSGVRCMKILFAGDIAEEYKDEALEARFRQYCDEQPVDVSLLKPGYLVSAYFVWIMTRVRRILQKEFGTNLLLNYNVCLPIDTFEKVNVRGAFQRAINIAEHLEVLWDEETDTRMLKTIAALWGKASDQELRNSRVHLVPEAVAQMASYMNSLAAEKKIHGVIDFGAGTTDFSIFNLREEPDEGKCTYWYNAITFPGGMERVEAIVAKHRSESAGEINHGELQAAMENVASERPAILGEVRVLMESLWEKARFPVWGTAYSKRKKESDWKKEKVKIFVCGGGSRLPHVKEVFGRSWYRDDWGPYEVANLRAPADFAGNPADFSRLAVAYGLTVPRPELQLYVLPKDCPDQTPSPLPEMRQTGGVWGPVYPDNH